MLVGVEAAGKAQPSVSLSHATRILSCPGWPVPPRLPSLPFSCPSMALTTPPTQSTLIICNYSQDYHPLQEKDLLWTPTMFRYQWAATILR